MGTESRDDDQHAIDNTCRASERITLSQVNPIMNTSNRKTAVSSVLFTWLALPLISFSAYGQHKPLSDGVQWLPDHFFMPILYAKADASTVAASVTVPIKQTDAGSNENLLLNGDFVDGTTHWNVIGAADASTGSLCVTTPTDATKPWDAQIGQNGLSLQSGNLYKLTFDMQADAEAFINVIFGQSQEPYKQYFVTSANLGTASQRYHYQFAMQSPDDSNGLFVLHIGNPSSRRFCVIM
ncbi:MAG: carbohydrate binding domain-containing protein [Caldilineaceae bacterium]